jgi:dolichyl-phosphate-mannose-protein mannosyltransferase
MSRTLQTALFLGLASLALFLAGIRNPPVMFFDEKLYVDAGNAILRHAPDPSPYGPPLGKLLVAIGIAAGGDNSFGWRWPSAVFGALTLVGVFLLVQVLLDNYALALTAAILTLLNNFLYVLSRIAMMDIYLVTFALWGVLAFVAALKLPRLSKTHRRLLFLASGALLGCAIACKWNGVDELAVVFGLGVFLFLRGTNTPASADSTKATQLSEALPTQDWTRCSAHLREAGLPCFTVSFTVLPILVYLATFYPLFHAQYLAFSAHNLYAANAFIWQFHRGIAGNTGLIVPWYKWPLMTAPTRGLSYLVGNWYVMWAGLLALLYALRRFLKALPETLLVSLYVMNMLQWIVTPQPCTFYYYYFPAATFLTMAIPVALYRLPERYFGIRLSVISVLPALCVFAFCFAHMAHLGAPYDTMLGYWP